jgi:hypothetical protein
MTPAKKPESAYTLLARQAKAAKLAAVIREHNLPVKLLNRTQWEAVAKLAKTHPPSDKTVAAVIEILEGR